MKKNKLKIIFLAIVAIICIAIPVISIADVGDFESYDSDWGSSSWDSDWGSSSWDSDWDSDWSSSSNSSWNSNGSSGDGNIIGLYVGLGMTGIIILLIIISAKGSTKSNTNVTYRTVNTMPHQQRDRYVRSNVRSDSVAKQVIAIDSQFNQEQFLAFAKNVFIKIQNAWSERDWETIRPFESEDLFEQHSKQLQGYIDRKQINKMERISVNYAELVSFSQDNEKDRLTIALNSSMVDYIIDEQTGKLLKGNKDYKLTNTYKMTFIRKKGVLTEGGTSELKTTNCPNCGAPTKITSSGRCEYCNSVITTGDHGWVLNNIERF